jgi:colicin import membrane protein
MRLQIATFLIAAHALFNWAYGQNPIKTVPAASGAAFSAAQGMTEAQRDAERERIGARRKQAEMRFENQKTMCYQKFMVTDCINRAKDQFDEAQAELRRQEIAINNAERKSRGATKIQSLQDKSSPSPQVNQREERVKSERELSARKIRTQDKKLDAQERALEAEGNKKDAAARQARSQQEAANRAAKAAQAPLEVQRYEQRQREAAQHKADLAKRLQEKNSTPAESLPVPP